ncbi:MAG: DUF983 domain-containing protein [Chitinophagales bacterium]|nr:DUF983 domain-containing protein [Chitinophagales bacterium]
MPPTRSISSSIFKLKCPQCREGELFNKPGYFVFNGLSDMPKHCPVCALKYEQEPGFFWGAMYVSYGLAVGIALPVFIISFALVQLTFWQSMGMVTFVLLLLVPFIFRLSRSIWIHMFVGYKPSKG